MDIRGRLLGLAIGATIPLVLAAVLDLWGTWSDTRRQINDSLRQQVEFAALAFEHWLDVQRQPLITIASYVAARDGNPTEIQEYLSDIKRPRTHWLDLRVLNSEGETVLTMPAEAGPLPPGLDAKLLDLLSHDQRAIETDWSGGEGKYLLTLAEPISTGGAIIARIDGAATAQVFRHFNLPTQSLITLFDPQRRIVYRSYAPESYIGANIESSKLFQMVEEQQHPVILEESAIDEISRVYSAALAGQSGYLVTIGVPSETLYRPAQRQLTLQLILIFLALCFTMLAALIIARSVVKPLRRLVIATRRFGKGDFSARAPNKGYDEIIELGDTFNEMAESIATREAKLKELDQLKSDFVSSVSHELRTPLTTIKTLTQLMKRRQMTEVERLESLETISTECDRQIDLVLNLLDLTRLESDALDILHTRVEPVEVIRSCIKSQSRTAELKGQTLTEDLSEDLPTIETDRNVLRRVLNSLIENAIKYTPPHGQIRVGGTVTDAHELALHVSDNGCGISPEDLPNIFKKFYRAVEHGDRGQKETSGVGLGLYLAQNLMKHLGGYIDVVSEIGQGSTFTIYLSASNVLKVRSKADSEQEDKHVAAVAHS